MSEKTKSRVHILLLANFAAIIAWYFWTNVRPKIIYASCSEVAATTIGVESRFNLNYDYDQQLESSRTECLKSTTLTISK